MLQFRFETAGLTCLNCELQLFGIKMVEPISTGSAASETGLGGALTALSAPVTKLIETCSAGLGRVYEPIHLRRMARAEGDRMVILADAECEVTELQRRAAQRWLAVEANRQKNIESIAEKAQKELPQSVDETPVDATWSAKFFDSCKDVSREDMQRWWAKLLAKEVAKPGAFSTRTLNVLASLSPHEAKLFEDFCSLLLSGMITSPFLFEANSEVIAAKGITYNGVKNLEAAGLIQSEPLGIQRTAHVGPLVLVTPNLDHFIACERADQENPTNIPTGTVRLTPAGRELCTLWQGTADAEHVGWVSDHLRKLGWNVEVIQIDIEHPEEGLKKVPDFALRAIGVK